MYEFKLPDLGEGVKEGEILHWHVKAGDRVKEDDPLVEIETDKAAVTIPSPRAGTVTRTEGGVGDRLAVGSVLVVIDDGGAAVAAPVAATPAAMPPAMPPAMPAALPPPALPPATPAKAAAAAVAPAAPAAPSAAGGAERGLVAAAPATRRLARELGIDLYAVQGSGPGGRVTTEDLRRHASGSGAGQSVVAGAASSPALAATAPSGTAGPAAPAGGSPIPFFEVEPLPDFGQWGPVEVEALRSIRRKVATKMVASMTIVPHVTHMDEADVTELDAFRREQNAKRSASQAKLTLLPFVAKALLAQLRKASQFNASIDPFKQEIVYKRYFNLGFAADTPRGLVVPVIHHADRLSIDELAEALQRLADKARAGSIDVAELRGGSFTITNVGSLGGTAVIPTINYPEAAILGLGRAADRAVVRDGAIVARKIMPMSLVFDHRLIDGADAARFLSAVVARLSDPGRLLLEG